MSAGHPLIARAYLLGAERNVSPDLPVWAEALIEALGTEHLYSVTDAEPDSLTITWRSSAEHAVMITVYACEVIEVYVSMSGYPREYSALHSGVSDFICSRSLWLARETLEDRSTSAASSTEPSIR